MDRDADVLQYSIEPATYATYFFMKPTTGQIVSTVNFAHIKERFYELRVKVTDGGQGDLHQNYTKVQVSFCDFFWNPEKHNEHWFDSSVFLIYLKITFLQVTVLSDSQQTILVGNLSTPQFRKNQDQIVK